MNITESKKLIGATVYQQNGATVTVRKIERIIVEKTTEKIMPWAVDKNGNGVHLGAVNSDEAAVKLIHSKMTKPAQSAGTATLVFA